MATKLRKLTAEMESAIKLSAFEFSRFFFQFRWVFSFLCLRYFLQDPGLRAGQIQKHVQQTYVQNRTRFAKVASYETSQETSVSCTQLVVLYAPFQFGSEYNFLDLFDLCLRNRIQLGKYGNQKDC